MLNLLLIELGTKMKPGNNSVEDHPQLSHNRHPVYGVLVGAGSLWPHKPRWKKKKEIRVIYHLSKGHSQK
jgi:hypothetical protein